MNWSIYIVILAVGIIGMFYYAQSSMKNKMHCSFRRANKTLVEKVIPIRSKYVFFDAGKKNPQGRYNIIPGCISLLWYNRGIHQYFPQWVPHLDFSWDSPDPLDPSNFMATWKSPEVGAASQQEGSMLAFSKGVQTQIGKKSRFPEWLFPMIIIGLIAILGYWIYQMSHQIATLQQLIQAIGQ